MRKNITCENAVLFACTFVSSLLLLSFDAYCKAEILTDIVFINIAGLAFHRMEFVSIVFSFAVLIGIGLEKLLKHRKITVGLSLSVLSILCAVIALLSTDLFQLLCPTMRISHVTMSLSRILGILAGVSGIFVGIATEYVLQGKANRNASVFAVILSAAFAVFMQSTGLYRIGFLSATAVVLTCTFLSESRKEPKMSEKNVSGRISKKSVLVQFLFFTAAIVLMLLTPRFLMITSGLGEVSASLTVGVFLFITVKALASQEFSVLGFVGMPTGSLLHYIIVHFVCTKTVYSGNRVIYAVPLWLFISVFVVVFALFVLLKRTRKRI